MLCIICKYGYEYANADLKLSNETHDAEESIKNRQGSSILKARHILIFQLKFILQHFQVGKKADLHS